ncbi:kyphoscoliosis peptidase [Niveomyces insectorum RCEF 264]|uniref:Kyphoscoliosis peptidase n=1 Tax=Niveomyces insectorum RCEF 264 TaxID=1081102 RepID=A0A168A934_9HYPO|nr:kyphoscoliosis peptidase [Niveomyces insectorum RCEF 264]
MADVEEPQFTTLAERIAALNKQKNFSSAPATSSSPIVRSASSSVAPGVRRPPPPPVPTTAASTTTSMATKQRNPPPVPRAPTRSGTVTQAAATTNKAGNTASPQLPVRRPTQTQRPVQATTTTTAPKLPPRSPSGQHLQQSPTAVDRRPSSESVASQLSSSTAMTVATTATAASSRASSVTSHGSASTSKDGSAGRKLPPAFGTTKLPPLPPSRKEREAKEQEEERAREERQREAAEHERAEREAAEAAERAPALPRRPGGSGPARHVSDRSSEPDSSVPRLPPRPRTVASDARADEPPPPALPARRPAVPSALDSGFNAGKSLPRRFGPQRVPQRHRDDMDEDNEDDRPPPPPPLASRPSRAQIDAVVRGGGGGGGGGPPKPRPRESTNGGGGAPGFYPKKSEDEECMICRDFSAPDDVASRYPIASLPRRNPVEYLARNLCDPFPSQTDKARAIFTWCHHNIAYDVDGFFNGCIPHNQTMEERIFSGKAVCEGYARVYEAVALAAGLECVVVTGHGKGFGFQSVLPGDAVPAPDPTGHAWNAVRIDGGEWKLLDACWGAGNVSDQRAERYEKRFSPAMFTMDNETFGERHFPENPRYFFRRDGRALSWREYVVEKERSKPATIYSNAPEQFIVQESMEPKTEEIRVRDGDPDELIHFLLGRPCRHWTMENQGRNLAPYPMMIQTLAPDGQRRGDMHDVHFDSPLWFWADIPRRQLGRPGDALFCYAMTTMDGRDMRGSSMADIRARWGRCSYSMQAVCSWRLV